MPSVLYYGSLSDDPPEGVSTLLTCFPLLGLDFWLDVNQQGVQWEAVGQNEVANIVATNTQGFQLSGLPVFQSHFHRLQVGVHAHINT